MSPKSLGDLLAPYNGNSVALHVGVSRSTVHSWKRGETFPSADKLPKLAEILRMDLGELTALIAGDSTRRNAERRGAA